MAWARDREKKGYTRHISRIPYRELNVNRLKDLSPLRIAFFANIEACVKANNKNQAKANNKNQVNANV